MYIKKYLEKIDTAILGMIREEAESEFLSVDKERNIHVLTENKMHVMKMYEDKMHEEKETHESSEAQPTNEMHEGNKILGEPHEPMTDEPKGYFGGAR